MVVQCCLCQKVRQGKQWESVSESTKLPKEVSHGYCPTCAKQAFEEIRQLLATRDSV